MFACLPPRVAESLTASLLQVYCKLSVTNAAASAAAHELHLRWNNTSSRAHTVFRVSVTRFREGIVDAKGEAIERQPDE